MLKLLEKVSTYLSPTILEKLIFTVACGWYV